MVCRCAVGCDLNIFNLGGWIQYGGRGGLAEVELGRYRERP